MRLSGFICNAHAGGLKVGCHSMIFWSSGSLVTFQSSPNPKVGCHSYPPKQLICLGFFSCFRDPPLTGPEIRPDGLRENKKIVTSS